MTDIKPGDLVVCVDDRPSGIVPYRGEALPVKGTVYTIRDLHPDGDAIWLVEIINPIVVYRFCELSFRIFRFRPVRDEDIAIFRKLAEPTDRRVTA